MAAARLDRAAPISTEPTAAAVAPFLATAHRRWLADASGTRWRRRPASVLAADVSWFTALAERAGALGTVESEGLTEALDAAAGRLFEAASAHGGDLLKLGADAILVAFEGPGHERRATQAATALPTALRGLPGDTAGAPPMMSIGVATGELDLFLVGADHRELIVCGPLVTRTVDLERAADPGAVQADDATVAAVNDARWSGLERGGHLLLVPPPASTVGLGLGTNGTAELPVADLLAGIPTGLRTRLGAGSDAVPRTIAVACIQVMGVDDLLDRAGPAAVTDALDTVVRTAQEACTAHRTTFLSTLGNAGAVQLILTAGFPDDGVDDVGRLVLAARRVVAADCALTLRAGVHHGSAVAVEVGSARRRVCTVLGDAAYGAARVMRHSRPGVVVATDRTLAEARTRFRSSPWDPLRVNQAEGPVPVSAVGPPLGADGARSHVTHPLVGRDAERRVLLAALDDARSGTGRIVVVLGDAGMGKSRLIAEVIAAASELPRLQITGSAYNTESPYLAVQAPLRQLLNVDADATDHAVVVALREAAGPGGAPWLPLLAPAFGVAVPDTARTADVEPRARRQRSHALIATLLRQLLPEHALVVVEDAHWLDDASTALLTHVLGAFADRSWLVVVGRRDQPGGLRPKASTAVTRVVLAPLDRDAATAMLDRDDDHHLPDEVLDAVIARSGGRPLFLEQLGAALTDGLAIDPLPTTVEAIVAARIGALGPDARRRLHAASVIGQWFPSAHLAGVAGTTPPAPAQAAPMLLAPGAPGWTRFHHALVQDVAYLGMPRRSRRELHDRTAEVIEADARGVPGRPERLSFHWSEAQRWEPAWHWSVLAAEQAAASGATVEAACLFRRAVRAAGHLDIDASELARVYERLADAEELNGRPEDASDALARARRLTTDPVRLAYLQLREGLVRAGAGSYIPAQRWFGRGLRALAAAPASADRERVRIDLVIAQAGTKLRQGRSREATQLLEAAIADAEATGHGRAVAMASDLLATVRHDPEPTD